MMTMVALSLALQVSGSLPGTSAADAAGEAAAAAAYGFDDGGALDLPAPGAGAEMAVWDRPALCASLSALSLDLGNVLSRSLMRADIEEMQGRSSEFDRATADQLRSIAQKLYSVRAVRCGEP